MRSAGTWAREGSPATREANAAAKAAGFDISRHKASRFTRELAAWADLIVTMTDEQTEEASATDPDAASRIFTLKGLVSILGSLPPPREGARRKEILARIGEADRLRADGHLGELLDPDVADPLGLSEPVYRAVAHELHQLLGRLVTALLGHPDAAVASEA